MSETKAEILLVGHCNPDVFAMRMALGRFAPGVEFVSVTDSTNLQSHGTAAGLLVNRVLDGEFGTRSGLELIEGLSPEQQGRSALVSDLQDAQAEAKQLGAVAGFGKTEMYSDKARVCIETLVGTGAESGAR